jgi:hypothetical protein
MVISILTCVQVSAHDVCGFCGRSPSCSVSLFTKNKVTKISSTCPKFFEIHSWLLANQSSLAQPSTNVPIVCDLCELKPSADKKWPAIWKYNMDDHIRDTHPEYALPGWPASPDNALVHEASLGRPGKRLPKSMTDHLEFRPEEETRLGVSASSPWSAIGVDGSQTAPEGSLSRAALVRAAPDDGFGGPVSLSKKRKM